MVGILCNALLCLGKVLAGVFSGSVALVADGVNNLSDAASSVVTLLGFRMAQRPADADHPYGHARYEYISGLVVAALILVIGADLAQSSVGEDPPPPAGGHLAGGLWGAHRRDSGEAVDVPVLCRAGPAHPVHHPPGHLGGQSERCDLLRRRPGRPPGGALCPPHGGRVCGPGGGGVHPLVGGGHRPGDHLPLLGQGADRGLAEKISALILSHEKVLGLHDLLVHDYGPGQCFASVHVEMSAQEDPLACHDLIDEIECQVLEALHVHLVIHYDPVVEDDAEWNAMRQAVEGVVAAVSPPAVGPRLPPGRGGQADQDGL